VGSGPVGGGGGGRVGGSVKGTRRRSHRMPVNPGWQKQLNMT
jgi:hypothetical protein